MLKIKLFLKKKPTEKVGFFNFKNQLRLFATRLG